MRVKVVEKFIRIAHTCYNHSNFSSLIQLMLGLQAHSVSRLSQTWARVRAQETRIMHDLVEFTSPFHNWKHLRDAMKNIADEWGGSSGGIATLIPPAPEKLTATSEGITFFSIKTSRVRTTESAKDLEVSTATMPSLPSSYISNQQSRRRGSAAPTLPSTPSLGGKGKDREQDRHLGEKGAVKSAQQGGCIPFLGLYLADLVFNSELPSFVEPKNHHPSSLGSEDTSAGQGSRPLVNIHKHRTTATIIKRVLTFRTLAGRYPFQPEPEVRDLLLAIEGVDPAEMLLLSNACEERIPDIVR
ncbi:hypothetical protein BGZ58_005322 [Dissophora ornata]|nr:hypothetical protein BGZ58_005322 [Dissophora ornata]